MEALNTPTKHYHEIRDDIRSGDILLCAGQSVFSALIQQATNSIWSHVAFILRLDAIDRIMVLESVESIGVRTIPLSNYVRDYNGTGHGYPGKLLIARHRNIKEENITNLSRTAVDLLGFPYGKNEIARIAARLSMHALGVNNAEKHATPQREFICSEYAYTCFKSIGLSIDYNPLGFITPADFANSSDIEMVGYIENNAENHTLTSGNAKRLSEVPA